MKNLSNNDKEIIEKLINGEIKDLAKYQERILEIKKKLSYKDYKEIFLKIPEIKLDKDVVKDVIKEDLVEAIQYLIKTGDYFNENADFNQSKDFYDKALTLNEMTNDIEFKGEIFMKLGSAYHSLDFYDKALSSFHKALDIVSTNLKVKIHNKIGLIYYEKKKKIVHN